MPDINKLEGLTLVWIYLKGVSSGLAPGQNEQGERARPEGKLLMAGQRGS